MFDALVAADLSVDDPDERARQLVDVLGLPELKPSWTIDVPSSRCTSFVPTTVASALLPISR